MTDWLVCDDFDKHFLSSSGRFARKKLANIGRTRQSNLEHFVTRVMFWVQNSGFGGLKIKYGVMVLKLIQVQQSTKNDF